MDRETYTMMAELMLKVPPKSETPEGQKTNFKTVAIVLIVVAALYAFTFLIK